MSIFSEATIKVNKGEQIQLLCVSHNMINPSIAISTQNKILLYSENGDKHDYELARNLQPTAIDWHPSQPLLGIGWENGTVTLWNEEQKQAKEETSIHKEAVNLLAFNPSGSRMVTADKKGFVVVWRGITPMCQYQKEGIMTHCVFADLSSLIKTNNLFFFGGKQGVVCLADDSKHCSDVCKVGGSIKSLLIYEKENSVIIITSSLLLVQFKISTTEKTAPDKKVKLSIAGDVEQLQTIWAGSCLLATVSFENMIRLWHLEQDENYVMTLHDVQDQNKDINILNDKICCLAYDRKSRVLVGGTKEGRILFWRQLAQTPTQSEQWLAMPFIAVDKQVSGISVGRSNGIIAARTIDTVKIITQTLVQGKLSDVVRILQIDSNKILIYIKSQENTQQMFLFDSKFTIKSIDCTDSFLVVQSSKKIEVHEIVITGNQAQIKLASTADEKCLKAAIHGENLILAVESGLNIANFKGVVKQQLTISENEGTLINFTYMGKTLVSWSTMNYFRRYDLGRKEYRQLGVTRKFENAEGPLGKLKFCCVNSDGSKVGILADEEANFFIYDDETDNFASYQLEQSRAAISITWDANDPRFFGVLTEFTGRTEEEKYLTLYTFFYTTHTGIKLQDEYQFEKNQEGLFAIKMPYLLLVVRNASAQGQQYRIQERIMNDFVGLEKADEPTKQAVINFSFHLSGGNLDEAYKSVKSIQNPAVWEKMAQMSVKNKRLDVAEICIGNMKFARGAKAIRESKQEPELEAQLAMVAIQLGMIGEAEKLYQNCKRYDLLNKLYQSCGKWEKALEVAEKYDRINMLSTYYKLARQHELSKEWEKAVLYFEKAMTYNKDVPRMYLENNELERLEDYVELKKDKILYRWWANYLESQERFDIALKYYKLAEDFQSIVRIVVHQGDLRYAKEICLEKGDPAACFYLAKQLELKEIIPEAIQFYARAQYYTQAVKLAKERNMDSDVMSLSLQGPKQVMVSSAAYFEQKNLFEKAIILYMKGKALQKAMSLAQKHKLAEYIKKINQEIQQQEQEIAREEQKSRTESRQSASTQMSAMTSEGEYGQLQGLINSKQYEKALDQCENNNIPITSELINKMLPPNPNENAQDEKKRKDVLIMIAERCKKMGNFEMASKIYIQMGDRVKAVKALIKLGDIEKVINFANNARTNEIYVLVGNYLQTGDWHKNPDLMKYIIQFYNKAKAFDHLAGFFDACSTVEIDEYRDYEKACAALKEALKHQAKSTSPEKAQRTQQLTQKLAFIEQFVQARRLYESDPEQMVSIFQSLLANPNIEYAIRSGDIHAQLIEYYYEAQRLDKAFEEITKMKQKGIVLNPYLDQEIIQAVMNYGNSQSSSMNPKQQQYGKQQQQQDEENFMEEEVIDDNI